MKNQYFGDVNDYVKYGLLRTLANQGNYKIGVCWMLTPDDRRADGNITAYLSDPERWRSYDPPLFDSLQKWFMSGRSRNIALAQESGILPGAEFYSEFLGDAPDHRAVYFAETRAALARCELIFYDPDNGIEVRSTAKGQRHSEKFIYWDELAETFQAGYSLLVYQHFPRQDRTSFIRRTVAEFQTRLSPIKVYWFYTPRVAYFLSVQEKHADYIAGRVRLVSEHWRSEIQVG